MASQPKRRYTLEEYLELERTSEERHEFWNGEIFAMSGGTLPHDLIMDNVFNALHSQLIEKNCRVFSSNRQIKVPDAPPYRYADGSVVCGKVEVERFSGCDLLLNPTLIYEVLSSTTEAYDRGLKFTYYKSVPSFKEYLLIAQDRAHVVHFIKHSEKEWGQLEYGEPSEIITLSSLDCTLPLTEIYRDVELVPSQRDVNPLEI